MTNVLSEVTYSLHEGYSILERQAFQKKGYVYYSKGEKGHSECDKVSASSIMQTEGNCISRNLEKQYGCGPRKELNEYER